MARDVDSLVVCSHCGQVHRWQTIERGTVARCVRCEAVIGRSHRFGVSTVLALTITAAVCFAFAATADIITLQLRGSNEASTLLQAIAAAWGDGRPFVASIAAATALVAPALFIALRLYVLIPLALGTEPVGFARAVRMLHFVARWNMVEVFTIGVLLSLVRLSSIADAVPGPGLYAFGIVTILFAAIESAGLKHLWWLAR